MSILFLLLIGLFILCAAAVLLSGAFLWYETANRRPLLLQTRLTRDRLRFAGRFLTVETFCLFISLLLRPLVWTGRRSKLAGPFSRPPVLLLNGLFHNRSSWAWMAYRLRRRGLPVCTLTLPLWHTPERALRILAATVRELTELGAPGVDLVAHSMGGMIVRQYLHEFGSAGIRRCVLLATPHHGSRLAPLAVSPIGRTLLPGSPYIRRMETLPFPPEVRCLAVHSRHDNLVLPWENARLEGVRNIELAGIGHTTLLYHPAVKDLAINELSKESDENT